MLKIKFKGFKNYPAKYSGRDIIYKHPQNSFVKELIELSSNKKSFFR
jgi:hypothetical protein